MMNANRYALPSGEIVNLPEHCTADIERFQLRNRMIVWAVRIDGRTDDEAKALAKRLPVPVI
jgi:hypothetical protein